MPNELFQHVMINITNYRENTRLTVFLTVHGVASPSPATVSLHNTWSMVNMLDYTVDNFMSPFVEIVISKE